MLGEVVSGMDSGERLLICGDLNWHVGSKIDGFEGVHRGFGFGKWNVEGEMILETADALNLAAYHQTLPVVLLPASSNTHGLTLLHHQPSKLWSMPSSARESISKLMYASPAWFGFLSESCKARCQGVIQKLKRSGYFGQRL